MPKISSRSVVQTGSIAVAFLATMLAMWSFTQEHLIWGGYNLAIAIVALALVVAARSRADDA